MLKWLPMVLRIKGGLQCLPDLALALCQLTPIGPSRYLLPRQGPSAPTPFCPELLPLPHLNYFPAQKSPSCMTMTRLASRSHAAPPNNLSFMALLSCNDSNNSCVVCVSVCLLCSKAPRFQGLHGIHSPQPAGSCTGLVHRSTHSKCVHNEHGQGQMLRKESVLRSQGLRPISLRIILVPYKG